jgi:hypothetical protein
MTGVGPDKLSELIDETNEAVDAIGCDSARLTKAESLEFYQSISEHAEGWADILQHEIEAEAEADGDDDDEK